MTLPEHDGTSDEPCVSFPAHVEIGDLLATTDHARVFSGFDRRSRLEVVLKEYRSGFAQHARREARALARLGEHPGILSVLAIGHSDAEHHWIMTERAAGGSLAQHIGAAPKQVSLWAAQLAEALAHTHANAVVHGDVTPSNVLLGADNCVRLGDFGSAVLLDDVPATDRPTGHTPAYAAPERRRLEPVSPGDDVYSLAATMFKVCGDHHGLPGRTRRALQRCLGAPQTRPDATWLARTLTP